MPYRPKTPCRHPGCPELVESGSLYCEKHRPLHPEVTRPAAKRGYNRRWQKTRKAYLEAHLFSSRQMDLIVLNRLGVKPEDVGQKHTEPKEPPADPKPSAETPPAEPPADPKPVLDMDGKTEDGSIPYNILMKQLECMK